MHSYSTLLTAGIVACTCAGCKLPAPAPATSPAAVAATSTKTVVLGHAAGSGTPAPAVPGVNVPNVKIDTVGFRPGWRKLAIFNVEPIDPVVRDASGTVVYRIPAEAVVDRGVDPASQDPVWQVDFTGVEKPGSYTITGKGARSDRFVIGEAVYDEALVAGLKSFYFQRTRMPLEKPYAVWKGDAYTRAKASHVHKDVGWDLMDYPEKKHRWKVEGGWHDAGNFDMYVPSTAPSAQTLLMAYEWAPSAFDDKTVNIPESGNGIPDVLDEARWGLIWVLSMQEPGGGFRHREAVMGWGTEMAADEDVSVRWIAGLSTSATAKAVSALAVASRVYAPFDAKFAHRCGEAARAGWAFLQKHPDQLRADGKGSHQPLWDDEPEHNDVGARFIAAVEMWRSFRDKSAFSSALELMRADETQPAEILKGAWANLSRWGLSTLALDEGTPPAVRALAKKRVLAAAELVHHQIEEADGYRCASTPADYYWGHNSNLLEKTHVLAVAHRLDPDAAWIEEAIRDQWHWILGRNPNGYSMVTRVGKGPDRLYHMEWGKREPPPPGYLIGGPNGQDMKFLSPDAPAKALLWDNPAPLRAGAPAHALWHWRESDLWDGGFTPEGDWAKGWWAVQEPDILYSANFVLAAAFVR